MPKVKPNSLVTIHGGTVRHISKASGQTLLVHQQDRSERNKSAKVNKSLHPLPDGRAIAYTDNRVNILTRASKRDLSMSRPRGGSKPHAKIGKDKAGFTRILVSKADEPVRDPTKADENWQMQRLDASIRKIERRLMVAGKQGNLGQIEKLAKLLANQRAKGQLIVDRLQAKGMLAE